MFKATTRAILTATLISAAGLAASASTASAGSYGSLHFGGYGGPSITITHGYGHNYYKPRRFKRVCHFRTKRIWSNYYGGYIWKKVRRCKRVRVW